MLSAILGLPVIGTLIKSLIGGFLDAYKAKLSSETSRDATAADLAKRELDVQSKEIEAQTQLRIAQVGVWYEPEKLMGYTVAIYFAKLLIWDKVMGDWTGGSTDPLAGWAATTANLIVVCYFGKRTIDNVARILKR
jgi:hypothetical protein